MPTANPPDSRKNVELQETKDRYEKFFEATPFGIVIHDGRKLLTGNQVALRLVGGSSVKALVGKPILKFIHPDFVKSIVGRLAKAAITGRSTPLAKEKFLRLDGTAFNVEATSSPVRYQGKFAFQTIFRDISTQVKEEEELRKFKIAVDSAYDYVVITDPSGIVLYANPAVERLTGFRIPEILGKQVGTKELWGGMMDKSFYQNFWRTIKKEKKVFTGEIKNKRKDGRIYEAFQTVTPILNEKEEVLFFLEIQRDITREKEADRAKTEFVSLASHQLLTPLSAVKWYLELILAGNAGAVEGRLKDYLETTYQSTTRMGNLVNALLNVSRIEMGTFSVNPEPTKVSALAEAVLQDFQSSLTRKKLRIKRNYKTPAVLLVDQNLMDIILQNLISNAVKYTREGGRIEIGLGKSGRDYLVKVSDTGYGIPQDEQPEIFTKLYRGKNIQEIDPEGVGLGLYIVKSIVEKLGGRIRFESKEGQGTTFFVTIPLAGMTKQEGTRTLISRKEHAKPEKDHLNN